MFNFLVSLLVFFIGVCAQAQTDSLGRSPKTIARSYGRTGLLIDTGAYLSQTQARATPAALNEWQTATSVYDIKIGYIREDNIYYGAVYSLRSDNQISLDSSAGAAAGVGFGYFSERGVNTRIFYNFNDTFGSYAQGSGFEVNLGYLINITANFFIGFNISFRESTYRANETIIAFDSWTRKETYPFLNLGLLVN